MFLDPRIWLAIFLIGGSLGLGWTTRGWFENDARLKEQRAAALEQFRRAEVAGRAGADHESVRAQLDDEGRTINEGVNRVVEKPVYRDVCLDDDGMRELTAAITGRRAASQPATAVPAASATGQR